MGRRGNSGPSSLRSLVPFFPTLADFPLGWLVGVTAPLFFLPGVLKAPSTGVPCAIEGGGRGGGIKVGMGDWEREILSRRCSTTTSWVPGSDRHLRGTSRTSLQTSLKVRRTMSIVIGFWAALGHFAPGEQFSGVRISNVKIRTRQLGSPSYTHSFTISQQKTPNVNRVNRWAII